MTEADPIFTALERRRLQADARKVRATGGKSVRIQDPYAGMTYEEKVIAILSWPQPEPEVEPEESQVSAADRLRAELQNSPQGTYSDVLEERTKSGAHSTIPLNGDGVINVIHRAMNGL